MEGESADDGGAGTAEVEVGLSPFDNNDGSRL